MFTRLSILILVVLLACSAAAQVLITIDTSTKFQTIEGWGHGGGIFSNLNYGLALYGVDKATTDSINHQYLDFIAHDLGLTGSRMWEVGPRPDGTGTDVNGDCDSLDWSKFQATSIDSEIGNYSVYFKNLVEAEGYKTSFYSSTSYPNGATEFKPWVLNHPGERAQQIWANSLWWKNTYDIDINYDVIYNEPSSPVTTQILVDDIKALAPRMLLHGLSTKTQYAEAVAPQTDWNFITPVQSDLEFWKSVGRFSYHNYGTADPYRADIRDFAKTLGLTTAQTEMGNPTIDDLFNDLLFGGVSYWEIAFSGSNTLVPSAGNTSWTPSGTYFRLRQLMHYVRPGDVRIGVASSDSLVRVVAFEKNGAVTVVILNGNFPPTASISGLPPGKYGVSQSPSGATAFRELGIVTVGADGKLTDSIGGPGFTTTIYPYISTNHPPTIESWNVSPGYIVAPTTSASLSAKASDPELDNLSYEWTIVSEPAGASAAITKALSANASVGGLTVPGMYVFQITVSDGTNTVSRKEYLMVFATNPPPILGQAGFRISPPYGLVFTDPGDTTHANIEQPTSAATLQVGIGDLANSDFSGRGKWTIVSQPPGGVATLDTTIYIYISVRSNVSNMTVPGDYVFQCNITNPGHPDLISRIICSVHPASSGPVINSIAVTPDTVALPQSSSSLSASTTDPEGQLLRHWWVIKSAPANAYPVFDHQGLANTNVSGLNIIGTYVFTLRTFDDIHMATKDVSITVKQGSGIGILSVLPDTLDFGIVDTGKSAKLIATISNVGSGSITVNSLAISLSFTDTASKPIPVTLQAADSLQISVVFSPHTIGAITGSLSVTLTDNSTALVSLKGVGKAPDVGSVATMQEVGDISIYPNPTTDQVTIICPNDQHISHVTVVNLLGQVVLDDNVPEENLSATISLHNLPSGIYSVIIFSNETVIRKNIIKQ